jgi:hypothetical protein
MFELRVFLELVNSDAKAITAQDSRNFRYSNIRQILIVECASQY